MLPTSSPRLPTYLCGMFLCLATVLTACARPQPPAAALFPKDGTAESIIVPHFTGFTVLVSFVRYKRTADEAAVVAVCTQAGTALAYMHAAQHQHPIRPLGAQDVQLSPMPTSPADLTACLASVHVEWAR